MHRRPISGNSVAHSKYTDQENTARRGDHYGTIVCTFKITIIAFADPTHNFSPPAQPTGDTIWIRQPSSHHRNSRNNATAATDCALKRQLCLGNV